MARTKGSGTPHKKNGIWIQWLSFTLPSGEQIRKKVEGQTKQRVIERVAKLRELHAEGVDLSKKPPTLGDAITAWIRDTYAHSGAKPRSVATYRQIARDYLIPRLGAPRIDQVNAPAIRKVLRELEADGYAAKTIGLCRTVLRHVFAQAIDDDILTRNPMLTIKSPTRQKSPAKSMTVDEAQRFRAAARSHRLALGLELGLIVGMRRGEVAGLKWDDVDLKRGILRITRNLGYIPPADGVPGALVEGTPKSESGNRALKLSAALVTAFEAHHERQAIERAAMGGRWRADEGSIFVGVSHGGRLNPGMLYVAFREVCTAAGISGYRLHDLRHSTASLLFAQGTSDKLVSSALGHSDTAITRDLYTHLMPGALDTIAESVEHMLSVASTPTQDAL